MLQSPRRLPSNMSSQYATLTTSYDQASLQEAAQEFHDREVQNFHSFQQAAHHNSEASESNRGDAIAQAMAWLSEHTLSR